MTLHRIYMAGSLLYNIFNTLCSVFRLHWAQTRIYLGYRFSYLNWFGIEFVWTRIRPDKNWFGMELVQI